MKKTAYIRSFSATVLWLIKFMLGCIAAYFSYRMIYAGYEVWKWYSETGALPELNVFGTIKDTFALTGDPKEYADTVLDYIRNSAGKEFQIMFSWITICGYLFLYPLFLVFDAIGATLVRFTKSGTLLVRFVHFLQALICLAVVVESAVSIGILVNLSHTGWALPVKDKTFISGLILVLFILWIIQILVFGYLFAYHKDIILIMGPVAGNQQHEKKRVRRTHLSALSFGMGIWFLLLTALTLYVYLQNEKVHAWQLVLVIGIFAACSIKQFLVTLCNLRVKHYNKEMDPSTIGNRVVAGIVKVLVFLILVSVLVVYVLGVHFGKVRDYGNVVEAVTAIFTGDTYAASHPVFLYDLLDSDPAKMVPEETEEPKMQGGSSAKPEKQDVKRDTSSENHTADKASVNQSVAEEIPGVRAEFKEEMDSYVAFYDEYLAFLDTYDSKKQEDRNKYREILQKSIDLQTLKNEYDVSTLSKEEREYFDKTWSEISKKQLEAISYYP